MPTDVRAYDPTWPTQAAVLIDDLHRALPGEILAAEHFGSTSVPGLAAKPIIDVMIALKAVDDPAEFDERMATLGFERFDNFPPGRLFYRRDGAHAHLVPLDGFTERNELLLRDYLRKNSDEAARYAALKLSIAAAGLEGLAYTKAKTELIQELTDRARSERGLPSVNVWEE